MNMNLILIYSISIIHEYEFIINFITSEIYSFNINSFPSNIFHIKLLLICLLSNILVDH